MTKYLNKNTIIRRCKQCGGCFCVNFKRDKKKYCNRGCYWNSIRTIDRRVPDFKKIHAKEYYKNNPQKFKLKTEKAKEKRRKKRFKIDLEVAKIHPLLVTQKNPINGIGGKFRKGMVIKCTTCKKDFYIQKSESCRLFCSFHCWVQHKRNNSKRICIICNSTFHCSKSQLILRRRKTCSRKCRSVFITINSEKKRLKNPPTKGNLNRRLRSSTKLIEWRRSVFERDNYTCQQCGDRNGMGKNVYLQAHHIKSWAEYPDLRFELSNGKTLCKSCHKKEKHPLPYFDKKNKRNIKTKTKK